MRIDVLTIFPDYLAPLDLSLVGKARAAGLLDLRVHDLRGWTTDRHRTVDDTPFGGGAGMVMRPDVWGVALDAVLDDDAAPVPSRRELDPGPALSRRELDPGPLPGDSVATTVLLVPSPAGEVFTQRTAEELAGAGRLVLACGRYEGIDARVVEHYAARPGITVREVSIGDYVLGGGEVAALVMVEAVTRLLPGVVGNPESLVEESHGTAGLLEYPVYTKPPRWRDLEVPEALTSGHHAKVARWRRDRALERTAARRPDLLERLAPDALDRTDRSLLGDLGWYAAPTGPRRVALRPARAGDAAALADLAAVTFPLACPPSLGAEAIAEFLATQLDETSFARYLADPGRILLAAEDEGRLVGYTMTVLDSAPPGDEQSAGVAELSKCYVLPEAHGSGLAGRLLAAATDTAARRGMARMWLGTNAANHRARRFYERWGFAVVDTRTFDIGGVLNDDVVMSTPISAS